MTKQNLTLEQLQERNLKRAAAAQAKFDAITAAALSSGPLPLFFAPGACLNNRPPLIEISPKPVTQLPEP